MESVSGGWTDVRTVDSSKDRVWRVEDASLDSLMALST